MGIFFRTWNLEKTPPGVQYDEAYNALDGLKASQEKDFKLFFPENNGREGLYINLVGISLDTLGTSNFSLRIVSAIFGILTLFGFFFLARELRFSRLAALFGLFTLTFSFWHLNFSRLTYRAIMVPFLLVWLFFFFFKGLHSLKKSSKKNISGIVSWKGYLFFLVSGLLTGVGAHTYIAFRVVPLIFFGLVLLMILADKNFLKTYWKSALVFLLSALLSASPILAYFYQNPADFSGRSSAVSIFNAPGMSFWEAFSKSLGAHLASFFLFGDANQRHNHSAFALIPMVWSVLFALGFGLTLKEIFSTVVGRFKKTKGSRLFCAAVLAQGIFWAMLIPGVLSIEGIPHALRIIGAIPAVFLFISFGIEYLLKLYADLKNSPLLKFKPLRWNILRIALGGILATVVLSGFSQIYLYFNVWANDPRTDDAFERELFDLGKLVKELPPKEKNYLIVSPEIAVNEQHSESSLKTTQFSGHPQIRNYLFYRPFEALSSISCEEAQNKQFVFQKSDAWLRNQFELKCPELSFEQKKAKDSRYEFWVLR